MLHADDAGQSALVDGAILDLLDQGRLGGISILAHGPDSERFCAELRRRLGGTTPPPQLFLHFDLTEHRRPGGGRRRAGWGAWRSVWGSVSGGFDPYEVRVELEQQMAELQRRGLRIVGVDSHHHVHAMAPVAGVVDAFARQNGLRLVRTYDQMICVTAVGRMKRAAFAGVARLTNLIHAGSPARPSTWSGRRWQPFSVATWERLSGSALESAVVCHPGRASRHEPLQPPGNPVPQPVAASSGVEAGIEEVVAFAST